MRMSDEEFQKVIDTNRKGTFHCMRAAIRPMMKKRRGRIISISSVVGLMGNAGQTNYAASKAGVIGMTKSLARAVASRHITVNSVAPGFIKTYMTAVLSDSVKEGKMCIRDRAISMWTPERCTVPSGSTAPRQGFRWRTRLR